MPITIAGTPFRTSSARPTALRTAGGANSFRYTATRIPTGSAIAVASATITSEPAKAFARPCFTGVRLKETGVRVIRSRFSAAAPRIATDQTTMRRIATPIAAASQASSSMSRFTARRRGRPCARSDAFVRLCELIGLPSPQATAVEADALPSRDAADDHLRADVHDEREHEQDQPEIDEARDLDVALGALVRGCDLARERVAGVEQVPVDEDAAPDHLCDSDGLSDRAPEAEDQRGGDAPASVR